MFFIPPFSFLLLFSQSLLSYTLLPFLTHSVLALAYKKVSAKDFDLTATQIADKGL